MSFLERVNKKTSQIFCRSLCWEKKLAPPQYNNPLKKALFSPSHLRFWKKYCGKKTILLFAYAALLWQPNIFHLVLVLVIYQFLNLYRNGFGANGKSNFNHWMSQSKHMAKNQTKTMQHFFVLNLNFFKYLKTEKEFEKYSYHFLFEFRKWWRHHLFSFFIFVLFFVFFRESKIFCIL